MVQYGKDYNKNIIYWLILMLTTVLFLATRLFRLNILPFGAHVMHIDEIGAAYDAFCISNFGVDQYLYKFPVYFKCFGEGQNALYTYVAAIIFKLLGVSIFKFRLVAVICAFLAFVALYFLAKRLFDDTYALVSVALMTVLPVFMMSERWGLECYLFLSFATIAMCFTIKATFEKRMSWFIISGLLWGLTLYNYAITYVTIPPFIILLALYLIYVGNTGIKSITCFVLPVILLGIPLLVQQLVMMSVIAPFEFLGIIDFWQPEYYRYDSLSLSNVWSNLIHTSFIILGSDHISYNSNEWFGTIYYFSIPFMFIGLYSVIKRGIVSIKARILDPWCIVFIYYIVARIVILFVTQPNVNRSNGLYLPYLLFTVLGIRNSVERVNRKWFSILIAVTYLGLFISFSFFYYSYLGYDDGVYKTAPDYTEGDIVDTQPGEAIRYAKSLTHGKEIYALMNEGWYIDYSVALFSETSPYEYSNDNNYGNDNYNGVIWGFPDNLDLSGETAYVIDTALRHITDYLVGEGFQCDSSFDKYDIVYR